MLALGLVRGSDFLLALGLVRGRHGNSEDLTALRSPIFTSARKFSGHGIVATYRVHSFHFHPPSCWVLKPATAATTSFIETEVLTWDVYSSMARSGLPNSGLGSDEVKAGESPV